MREIHVSNASVLTDIKGHKVDYEIRDNDKANGLSLVIDGVKIIDLNISQAGTFQDGSNYSGPTLFQLRSVKSNGCMSAIRIESGKIIIQ
jgi:hypothetical protein